MKQVAIISGKGGTGKTTIAGALASLFKNSVFVDCDVDAPDLHLLLKPEIKTTTEFLGGKNAIIDPEKCINCGKCQDICRFDAIFKGEKYFVDEVLCDGCALCPRICPADAIVMQLNVAGEWYISNSIFGDMIHAKLFPGQENSGKLITMTRHQATLISEEKGRDFVLIDGPPGTGCPVISSITGVDHVIIVTEPTVSGISDFERTVKLVQHFGINIFYIINKFDLNLDKTNDIDKYCLENSITLLGKIPFDPIVNEAVSEGKVLTEFRSEELKEIIIQIYNNLMEGLNG